MKFKVNQIVNKFWLAEDKFIPKFNLKQLRFTCSACDLFTKHRERIEKFRETGDLKHIIKNKLNKSCFGYEAAYSDSKYLERKELFQIKF